MTVVTPLNLYLNREWNLSVCSWTKKVTCSFECPSQVADGKKNTLSSMCHSCSCSCLQLLSFRLSFDLINELSCKLVFLEFCGCINYIILYCDFKFHCLQVKSDVLHVWISVPCVHHTCHHLLGNNDLAVLLPFVCRGKITSS
jgi:hypothetical protein